MKKIKQLKSKYWTVSFKNDQGNRIGEWIIGIHFDDFHKLPELFVKLCKENNIRAKLLSQVK